MSTAVKQQNQISGVIKSVTFSKKETGYCVLKIKSHQDGHQYTITGYTPSPLPGMTITANGQWINDRQYGQQLRATHLETALPTAVEDMELYLSSGCIEGIGPTFAKRLIDAFGEKSLDILDNEPHKLRQLPGMGQSRFQRVMLGWQTYRAEQDLKAFFNQYKLPYQKAGQILSTYGVKAKELIEQNPYRLLQDFADFTFYEVDQLAKQLQSNDHSSYRILAAIRYILWDAYQQKGLTCLTFEKLCQDTQKLVKTDFDWDAVLEEGKSLKLIKADYNLVSLYEVYKLENDIVDRLKKIQNSEKPWKEDKAKETCEAIIDSAHIDLSDQQKDALFQAIENNIFILTGGPGVGKTTLLKFYCKIMKRLNMRLSIAAPTGRAAKRITESTGFFAKTIHRLLASQSDKSEFYYGDEHPLPKDVIIIDECSMIDLPLFHALISAIDKNTALLLVGDPQQLPPIGPGQIFQTFIESKAIPHFHLDKIYRQKAESKIVHNAYALLNQDPFIIDNQSDKSDFYCFQTQQESKTLQQIIDLFIAKLPHKFGFHPQTDIQILSPMHKGILGTQNINQHIQDNLFPNQDYIEGDHQKRFFLNDRVIQLENNYDLDVFNGDIGIVTDLDFTDETITVTYDQDKITYKQSECFQIQPAHCITVHKAQGSEFPAVIMPLTHQHRHMLSKPLLYTAMTRAQKLLILIGQKQILDHVKTLICPNQSTPTLLYHSLLNEIL